MFPGVAPVSAARAYAALRNGDRAVAGIRTAEDAWDTVEPDAVDEPGGICTFSRRGRCTTVPTPSPGCPVTPTRPPRTRTGQTRRGRSATRPSRGPTWRPPASHRGTSRAPPTHSRRSWSRFPEQRMNGIVHSAQRVHEAVTRAGLADDTSDLIEQIEDFTHMPPQGAAPVWRDWQAPLPNESRTARRGRRGCLFRSDGPASALPIVGDDPLAVLRQPRHGPRTGDGFRILPKPVTPRPSGCSLNLGNYAVTRSTNA
ncbi:hypothetical protein GA0070214_11772 [Micromonospora chaiyaphumensis]|uniref:Uncharacterized protein n=1 Tax=Micromonospora chaiyaphumensis TaxID=307119 RepID=A0A1C4ZMG7_9ACTN|nr:hypothetical protein GA0070214_11772 [Micromonospora chaiyaphumensis]